jgi:hypothetical protein
LTITFYRNALALWFSSLQYLANRLNVGSLSPPLAALLERNYRLQDIQLLYVVSGFSRTTFFEIVRDDPPSRL